MPKVSDEDRVVPQADRDSSGASPDIVIQPRSAATLGALSRRQILRSVPRSQAAAVLALQQRAGNRAVTRLLQRGPKAPAAPPAAAQLAPKDIRPLNMVQVYEPHIAKRDWKPDPELAVRAMEYRRTKTDLSPESFKLNVAVVKYRRNNREYYKALANTPGEPLHSETNLIGFLEKGDPAWEKTEVLAFFTERHPCANCRDQLSVLRETIKKRRKEANKAFDDFPVYYGLEKWTEADVRAEELRAKYLGDVGSASTTSVQAPGHGQKTPTPEPPGTSGAGPGSETEPARTASSEGPPKTSDAAGAKAPALSEGRGEPVRPIENPAVRSDAIRGGVEGAWAMIAAEEFEYLQGAQVRTAIEKLAELTPQIEQLRTEGFHVQISIEVEVPEYVNLADVIAGVRNPGMIVFFKDAWISATFDAKAPRPDKLHQGMRPGGPPIRRGPWYTWHARKYWKLAYDSTVLLAFVSPHAGVAAGSYKATAIRSINWGEPDDVRLNGLHRWLDVHPDGRLVMTDDDSTKPWRGNERWLTTNASEPFEARFERTASPKCSIKSTFNYTTVKRNGGQSPVLIEQARAQSSASADVTDWSAEIVWLRVGM